MEVILDKIATGTDFDMDELVTIYKAFCKVGAGHSAKLRDAIGSRLQKEDMFGLVSDVPIDASESVEMEAAFENESDVVEIESDASV